MPVKNVFKEFRRDTQEVIEKLVMHDWERMLLSRLVEDPEQKRRIKNELICNFNMLNEIYILIRSHSKHYPFLSPVEVSAFLCEKLGFNKSKDFV